MDVASVGNYPEIRLPNVSLGRYQGLFGFRRFNALQSECFNHLFHHEGNLLVTAPTGSGKTVLFELAILQAIESNPKALAVYVAPTKALCAERFDDWHRRFGSCQVKIQVLTGDAEDAPEIGDANVLVCTAEKLDSVTRTRSRLSAMTSRLRAILLDQVHLLGEPRGAVVEAIVARFAMAGGKVRLVGTSATMGNPEDIAQWFEAATYGRPTRFLAFNDQNRSVPLRRHVLSFATRGMNSYQFENSLNSQLPWIIDKYSSGLPTLVFCSTRKSAETCAFHLARSTLAKTDAGDICADAGGNFTDAGDIFTDIKLNELVSKGIAYHHAGLRFEDRRAIEFEFTRGKIKILCATSTLAARVNLLAHLVILKGTKQYLETGYREYSPTDIQQMMERAGRPQADKFGVAIILTSDEQKHLYDDEQNPQSPLIESQVKARLPECLLSELSLELIVDVPSALEWIAKTFFHVRAHKRPKAYGFRRNLDVSTQLQDHCRSLFGRLERTGLATISNRLHSRWSASPWAAMANGLCLSIHALIVLHETPTTASHDVLLQQICRAMDPGDCKLQLGDKKHLQPLTSRVRFKLRGKVTEAWHKAFLSIQMVLNRDEAFKGSYSFHRDAKVILDKAKRLARGQSEILRAKGAAITLRHALELEGVLTGKVWHDSCEVLQQIEGIGASYSRLLAVAGIDTISALQSSDPHAIELALKRHTPFGFTIRDAALAMPRMALSCRIQRGQDGGRRRTLQIHYSAQTKARCSLALLMIGKGKAVRTLYYDMKCQSCDICKEIPLDEEDVEVTVSWMSLSHAGLNLHKVLQLEPSSSPITANGLVGDRTEAANDGHSVEPVPVGNQPPKHAPLLLPESIRGDDSDKMLSGLEDDEERAKDCDGGQMILDPARCKHVCRDKQACRHQCCKTGIQGKRRRTTKAVPITPPNSVAKNPARAGGRANAPKVRAETTEQRVRDARAIEAWLCQFRWTAAAAPSLEDDTSQPTSEIRIPITSGVPSTTAACVNFIKGLERIK